MNYIKKLYSGRINRKNYGLGLLFFILLLILFAAVFAGVLASDDSTFILIVMSAIYAVFIVHIFSLHVRRLHDLGESGWKALLFIIPLVNLITLIWLLSAKSKENDNEYGNPLPKDVKFFDVIFSRNILQSHTTPKLDMRYCHKCANQLEGDSKFCPKCGTKVLNPN